LTRHPYKRPAKNVDEKKNGKELGPGLKKTINQSTPIRKKNQDSRKDSVGEGTFPCNWTTRSTDGGPQPACKIFRDSNRKHVTLLQVLTWDRRQGGEVGGKNQGVREQTKELQEGNENGKRTKDWPTKHVQDLKTRKPTNKKVHMCSSVQNQNGYRGFKL